MAQWRWWDGHIWTPHVSQGEGKKPRLPGWLSPPVVVGALVAVPFIILLAIGSPIAILLGFVPLVIVLPVLAWLDRVEPEPRSSKIHAVLWGATIAGVVSGIVNTIVGEFTSETIAAVVSAPVVEEAMKALGIIWALRRRDIDGVMDGVVYAGWVALGFAVAEDFLYFASADTGTDLAAIFVVRAILTPFAHPLFTAWSGLAIGLAVARRTPVWINLTWGYLLAVVTHAGWNGALTYAESENGPSVLLVAIIAFIILFLLAGAALVMIRRMERTSFLGMVPTLAEKYGMSASEVMVFSDWKTLLATRKALKRPQRKRFDEVHAALARLAVLHDRPRRAGSGGSRPTCKPTQRRPPPAGNLSSRRRPKNRRNPYGTAGST